MTRQTDSPPLDDEVTAASTEPAGSGASSVASAPDLTTLPIAGITGRRVAIAMGILLAAWIVMLFARQVGDASMASARADQLVVTNAQQASRAAALGRELQQIQRASYVEQEARAYGLGKTREIAFTLDPNAPALPSDAAGSASVRLGSTVDDGSPLDHWLTLLFGAAD